MKIKEPVIAVFKIPADKITEVDFQELYETMIEKYLRLCLK